MPQRLAREAQGIDPRQMNYLALLQERATDPTRIPPANYLAWERDPGMITGEMRALRRPEDPVEGQLAESVKTGVELMTPLPFLGQFGGVGRFGRFGRPRRGAIGWRDTPEGVRESIDSLGRRYQKATGKTLPQRPAPLKGTPKKEIHAQDLAYRDRISQDVAAAEQKAADKAARQAALAAAVAERKKPVPGEPTTPRIGRDYVPDEDRFVNMVRAQGATPSVPGLRGAVGLDEQERLIRDYYQQGGNTPIVPSGIWGRDEWRVVQEILKRQTMRDMAGKQPYVKEMSRALRQSRKAPKK